MRTMIICYNVCFSMQQLRMMQQKHFRKRNCSRAFLSVYSSVLYFVNVRSNTRQSEDVFLLRARQQTSTWTLLTMNSMDVSWQSSTRNSSRMSDVSPSTVSVPRLKSTQQRRAMFNKSPALCTNKRRPDLELSSKYPQSKTLTSGFHMMQ